MPAPTNTYLHFAASATAASSFSTPVPGRVVDDRVLISNFMSGYNMAMAYGGNLPPAQVWAMLLQGGRTAIPLMRELEQKDNTVGTAIEEMKRSVLKRPLTVVPLDEANSQAAEIAAFVQAQLDGLSSWRNALDAMLDAPFYGYSVAEVVYDVSAGQVALADLRDAPQELFSFNTEPYLPQTGPLRLHTSSGDYSGTLVPENKFVVWSSRMRAGDRRGRPYLREAFWPSWFNRNVVKFWLRLVERGPGTAVTSYAQGATKDEQNQALSAAEALISNTAMAVPENMVIREEFLKVARSQDPAAFAQLADKMESQIIRLIVGETLTSKGGDNGKGTHALGKVHQDTKEERSVAFAQQLQDVLNRQLVAPLVLWNYGPAAPGVQLVIDTSDEEDLGARATVDDTLLKWKLPISQKYAYERYGIPQPQEGEALLTAPAAPVPTSPAGSPDAPQFADADRLAQWWNAHVEQTGEQPTLPEVVRAAKFADADPTITRQVHHEQSDYDTLFAQLAAQGRREYGLRIKQLADAADKARP